MIYIGGKLLRELSTISSSIPLFEKSVLNEFSQVCVEENGSWNFESQDTQYSSHCLHTYLAAMIPQLARRLIDDYVRPGGSVLDPFCGGGAVLVEAILSGRKATGCDINNLAVLVSKAKTTHIERQDIESTGRFILENARGYSGPPLNFSKSSYVDFWFKPYMLVPLTGLRKTIDSLEEGHLKDLFKVIFSATVRNVSLTYRNEIRLRRMSKEEQDTFNPDVFDKFEEKLNQAIERVPNLPDGCRAVVEKIDARSLPFRKNQFDAIVCSPPYGDERNGVPYTQFAKNMLYWLGFTREDIMLAKKVSLGWSKGEKAAPPSSTFIENLEKIREYPISVVEAIAFYADYFVALKKMAHVVRDRIMIVIGQRVLQNTVFDNAKITAELMAEIGINLEKIILRKLPTKRLPKMREYGAAINEESILIFKKKN
jgi:site-specific DNA-methyltransferase (cytosine-N4-specific)